MKLRLFCSALVLVGATAVVTEVVSQDEQEMMKRWMEFMTPGSEHQWMQSKAGDWTMKGQHWQAPGMEAVTFEGSSKFTVAMDGRYFNEHVKGVTMGMPFEGVSTSGYDNMKKKFFTTWIDNMGTGIMVMEGHRFGNAIRYSGTGPDPMLGDYVPMRLVETMVDENTRTLEMFGPGPDGKEFMTMKQTYKRAGKAGSK